MTSRVQIAYGKYVDMYHTLKIAPEEVHGRSSLANILNPSRRCRLRIMFSCFHLLLICYLSVVHLVETKKINCKPWRGGYLHQSLIGFYRPRATIDLWFESLGYVLFWTANIS